MLTKEEMYERHMVMYHFYLDKGETDRANGHYKHAERIAQEATHESKVRPSKKEHVRVGDEE